MTSSLITVTDLFSGAGGSSTGAVQAGAEVRVAVNHWDRAIETHQTNHPNALHILTDVSNADPRRFPATTILLASPECTNHSLAKGVARRHPWQPALPGMDWKGYDPSAERSRCLMWTPLVFAERHHYPVVILENVVDAYEWLLFNAWLKAWEALDYRYELVFFNSMFAHPTPQSRDRMYFVAWKKGIRQPDLTICPTASCPRCGKDVPARQVWKNPLWQASPELHHGKYKQQYVYHCPHCVSKEVTPYYYAAANAIDWSHLPQKINERKRPLTAKTKQRIAEGLQSFKDQPFTVCLNHERTQATPIIRPMPTQTIFDDTGLVTPPFLIDHVAEYRVRSIEQPMSTIVGGGNHQSLVVPPAWLLSYYHNGSLTPVDEPVSTVTTLERHALVTAPNERPRVEDCGFRMLEPHEIQAAMAFPRDYVVTGTRREKVKQLGNAVTPPVMRLLVSRCMAALA